MAKRPDVNDIIDPNNKPMDTEQNNILETKNQGKESGKKYDIIFLNFFRLRW